MTERVTPRVFKSELQRVLHEEGRRQTWLAEAVGIHPSRLSLIVNGLSIDDDDLKLAIASALRRTVDELWPDTDAVAA